MKPEFARDCLEQDIESGNISGFLIHLANADLSSNEIKILMAEMLDAEAGRKYLAAEEVDRSTKGVEDIAGDGSAERHDAENLTKLAQFFRSL